MRNLFSFLVLFSFFSVSHAQDQKEFLFANNLNDTAKLKIDYTSAVGNFLGPEAARKMFLMQETYTFIEKGTVIAPGDKTIVRKPEIYYAIKKLNKFYKKQVKKGVLDREQAAAKFITNVNKSYCMLYQESAKFEEFLGTLKTPEQIEQAYDSVKLY